MDINSLQKSRWILLPGTLCTSAVFDGFLDELGVPTNQQYTKKLASPKIEDYHSFFKNDVYNGDIICGFSLGAIVAAHHADIVHNAKAIVLFGINPLPDDKEKAKARYALQTDVENQGGRAAMTNRLSNIRGINPEQVRNKILEMAEKSSLDIKAQTTLAMSRPGAANPLSASNIPILALCGTNDDQVKPQMAAIVEKMAPNGQSILLPGLGHYALLEDPTACANAIRIMMKKIKLV